MRLQRTCAGLATAALCIFGISGVAGAAHSAGGGSGPPQDFASGSLKGTVSFGGSFDYHARFTAHLPATQPSDGSFDGRGEAVATIVTASGDRTQHRGHLLCGSVDGTAAFLLFALREPVETSFGPARHMALMPFDNGEPNEEPADEVGIAFMVYGGPPPEETRDCSMIGLVFEQTHGNVIVHDSEG